MSEESRREVGAETAINENEPWPATQEEANALAIAGGEAIRFLMLRMFDKPVNQWAERDRELIRLILPLFEDRRMALDFMIAEMRTRATIGSLERLAAVPLSAREGT